MILGEATLSLKRETVDLVCSNPSLDGHDPPLGILTKLTLDLFHEYVLKKSYTVVGIVSRD